MTDITTDQAKKIFAEAVAPIAQRLDKIEGGPGDRPARPLPKFLPTRLDAAALIDTIDRLPGLNVPAHVAASAANGPELLRAAGIVYTVAEVDRATAAISWPVSDKIKFKNALSAEGLLASSDRKISNMGRL